MKDVLIGSVKQAGAWLRHQPLIRKFRHRYPRLSRFVAGRFDTEGFVGLPLTLVLLVFAVNLVLLSQLTASVVEAAWVVRVDNKLTTLLYERRSTALSLFFYGVTQLGEREAVFMVGGVVTAIFLYRRRYVALVAFWLTQAGVGLSTRYGKTLISRERPEEVAYYAVEHFSFPSGHATTAMGLYGLLAYFLYRHYKTHTQRRLLLWGAGFLILAVGFSRIYLGVHYLSDVLAGFLLGALWLLVGISLEEVMLYRRRRREDRSGTLIRE
jgi:membrane-associated phospholipid phosphatase